MDTDILIVGGGPAGLAFARQLKDSRLRVTIIEKAPLETLQNPPYDGREIALTHLSREIMQRLGMWQRIPENEIYRLRDAKVFNGTSDYTLHFPQPSKARGGETDRLGNLISNHNIRRAAYEEVAECANVELRCGVGVKWRYDYGAAVNCGGQSLFANAAAAGHCGGYARFWAHGDCVPHETHDF